MDAAFDPRPLFLRAVDQLEKLVAQIAPEQLDRATPCTEFDLRALLGHLVGAVHRIAYVGEGGRAMDVAAAVGEIEDTDWAAAIGRARARAAAAWEDDAKLDAVVEMPWGQAPGRIALSGYVMETVTHTWDIAQTVDPAANLDEELAQVALGIAQQVLPAELDRAEVPFGEIRPVSDDAGAYPRLAAWLGRAA